MKDTKSLIPSFPRVRKLLPDFPFDFDKQFDDFMDVFSMNKGEYINISEDGVTTVEVEVPGFNRDTINVHVEDGVLMVHGKRQTVNGGFVEIKRQYSVGMVDDIQAEVKDGILRVVLNPPEQVKPRRIEVK